MSAAEISREMPSVLVKKLFKLVLWAITGLAVAGLFVWANLSGNFRFGLGWTIHPGFVLLVLIAVFGGIKLRTLHMLRGLEIVACLIAAMLVQDLLIYRTAASLIGIALSSMGTVVLLDKVPKIRFEEVVLLLITSYIDSVCIYNLILGQQKMSFFAGGWTL
jgi:hypothetical protein